MASVADNLKKLRTDRRMTQEEVASQIGLTRQAISSYESGRTQPPVDLLVRFAEIYGVEPEDVLYGRGRDVKGERAMKVLALLTASLWIGSFLLCGVLSVACHAAISPTQTPDLYFSLLAWVERAQALSLTLLAVGCIGLLILDLGSGCGGSARRKAMCWALALLSTLIALLLWAWGDPVYVLADLLPYAITGSFVMTLTWGIDLMAGRVRLRRKQRTE